MEVSLSNLKNIDKIIHLDAGQYMTLIMLNNLEEPFVKKIIEHSPYFFNSVSFHSLEEDGYIQVAKGKTSNELHMMYAHEIVKYVEITIEGKKVIGANNIDIYPFVHKFRELFPKGVYTGSRLVKGDLKGCLKKMDKFLKENPDVTQEEIIEATKIYINKSKENFFEKMTCADYFIEKNGVSMLSGYIEQYRDGETAGTQTDFTEDI